MTLEIQSVSKQYRKNTYGLKDFSLTIDKGILGLLGPNGAGKSTLLKMIATVNKPTKGVISLNKNNIVKDPNYMRKQLGFLPQDFGVYDNLNAFEFLGYIAALKGVGGQQLTARIKGLLEGLNLIDVAKKPIGTYSGGMKQRVGIAQALLNNPKVVIFDEPTVGLDPEERVRFRNLLSELANTCIVILSSHIVSDIDTIADRVAIMKEGRLVMSGSQESIIAPVRQCIFEKMIPKEDIDSFKNSNIVLSSYRSKGNHFVRYYSKQAEALSTPYEATLEDAYLYYTKTN